MVRYRKVKALSFTDRERALRDKLRLGEQFLPVLFEHSETISQSFCFSFVVRGKCSGHLSSSSCKAFSGPIPLSSILPCQDEESCELSPWYSLPRRGLFLLPVTFLAPCVQHTFLVIHDNAFIQESGAVVEDTSILTKQSKISSFTCLH